jgi:hypothetical protein
MVLCNEKTNVYVLVEGTSVSFFGSESVLQINLVSGNINLDLKMKIGNGISKWSPLYLETS